LEVIADRMGLTAFVPPDANALVFHSGTGIRIVIEVKESDPGFVRMWTCLPGKELPVAGSPLHKICSEAQEEPGLKCWVDADGDVILSVEQLVAIPDTLPAVYYLLHFLPWAIKKLTAGMEMVALDASFAA